MATKAEKIRANKRLSGLFENLDNTILFFLKKFPKIYYNPHNQTFIKAKMRNNMLLTISILYDFHRAKTKEYFGLKMEDIYKYGVKKFGDDFPNHRSMETYCHTLNPLFFCYIGVHLKESRLPIFVRLNENGVELMRRYENKYGELQGKKETIVGNP